MRQFSRCRVILFAAAIAAGVSTRPQQPFDLDIGFRTEIGQQYVASALPVEQGKVIISGMIRFPGDLSTRVGVRLNSDGSHDQSFPNAQMGGKLVRWNDKVYAASGNTVRRSLLTGILDPDFIPLNSGPYFSSLQGGDYHVFQDGRVVLGGRHMLSDTIRGFVGPHCLTWFSNQGYVDTTRTHRPCNGVLAKFHELPNGQFIGSGSTEVWDGQPASRIFRFNADGSLDPSFQSNVWWGQAFVFLPLADGRVYAAGAFRVTGIADTLRVVRFMPDGSLDPTFNNLISFQSVDLSGSWRAIPSCIYPIEGGRLIITGGFEYVEGQPRQGICLIDTVGNLMDDYFSSPGCGDFTYQGFTYGSIEGIAPAPDGQYYIWGAYHAYDDGTTNDTLQRMVSRLHGFNVAVPEREPERAQLRLHPNPASAWVAIDYDLLGEPVDAAVAILDLAGREVKRLTLIEPRRQVVLDTRELSPGSYTVALINGGVLLRRESLMVQP